MLPLLLPALLLAAPVERDDSVTYLASISIPLGPEERISAFAFETWGVHFKAVCRIPDGWRIKAGSSLSPNGNFEGEASQGISWIGRRSMGQLRGLVLITLSEPMRRRAVRDKSGEALFPATFAGNATIETANVEREVTIDVSNIKLSRATRCP